MPALERLHHWTASDLPLLRERCAHFLAEKSMVGVRGLELSAPMQLLIAIQACLPVLQLGLSWYRGWSGIIVYPARFRVRREVPDEDGLVHELDAELSGEAWDGGPVVLSWEDADAAKAGSSVNVVIHEFAHKIDLLDGAADGTPPFDARLHPGLARGHWQGVLDDAYERFCAGLELLESEIPADVDPDSDQADPYYARLPLDPYAATDPAEFFAVSSEAYFLGPQVIEAAFPQWYGLLRRFYRPAGG